MFDSLQSYYLSYVFSYLLLLFKYFMEKRQNNSSQKHNMPQNNNMPNTSCLKAKSLWRLLLQSYALEIFLHMLLAKILKNMMSKIKF